MILYPAIDLMGGRCVRLRQGRFEDATIYPASPAEALARFAAAGASWAHVVDLDGARGEKPAQHKLIARLARQQGISLQVAGGFRSRDQVARMIDAGVGRVVIGSLAVHGPSTVQALLGEFGPERIALAFDVRTETGEPIVATSGWLGNSGKRIDEVAAYYPMARHTIVTDIGRDGMMNGPNLELYADIARRMPHLHLQASGGVSSLTDLASLPAQLSGAIVGKALWEGRIDLRQALSHARG
jgi:phosphoribosylformimino-5-aminoimidazole carboxamide ribotide isomerase